jgi:hypothetical protein
MKYIGKMAETESLLSTCCIYDLLLAVQKGHARRVNTQYRSSSILLTPGKKKKKNHYRK